MEIHVEELVLGNTACVEAIMEHAKLTTPDQPFLITLQDADKRVNRIVQSCIMNALSRKYSEGYIDADMRVPVVSKKYWFGLTCEKQRGNGAKKFATKLRVMIASDDFLRNDKYLSDEHFEPNLSFFEAPTHANRWQCLTAMRKLLLEEERGDGQQSRYLRCIHIHRRMSK